MTTQGARKRLTYIVNHVSANDAQHYVHIPGLLSELEKLGWETELVSERGGRGRAEILGRQVTFLSERSKTKRAFALVHYLLGMRLRGGGVVFVRISKFAAAVSALLGRLLGWKTVYWLSGTVEDFNLRGGLKARIGMGAMWVLLRLIDRLATGPEAMVHYYAATYRLPTNNLVLLYNDIDTSAGRSARLAQPEPRVLLVHRLSPVRETDRYFPALLDGVSSYAQNVGGRVIVDICGDGPERPQLEEIARNAPPPIDVRFHGAIPQRKLDAFYDRATIFVMPSYREGFPRVILEAMAHGLPIVATDAGGTRDILGPGQQAYVVNRDDPEEFGKAVERLLSSSEDRRRLSDENLATVQRFSTPQIALMYDRALSELIGACPAA
jgi:glycosyltransferase involved in cell wall biosynthesis